MAREAIADAGLRVEDVDGFTTSSLLPTAGDHAAVDGVSTVTPNWLAAQLGVNPRYATGFQGYGQLPGSVSLAVNAIASGAADHVLVHRALHNPVGKTTTGKPARRPAAPLQWTMPQGCFGPLPMIGMAVQRVLPALRRDAGGPRRRSSSRLARTAPGCRGRSGTTSP